jgi:hypothetical protein
VAPSLSRKVAFQASQMGAEIIAPNLDHRRHHQSDGTYSLSNRKASQMPSQLKAGWPALVSEYLARQSEPVTIAKVSADVFGVASTTLSRGEFNAVSQCVFNNGWRIQSFWIPPASEGPWTEEAA